MADTLVKQGVVFGAAAALVLFAAVILDDRTGAFWPMYIASLALFATGTLWGIGAFSPPPDQEGD